MKQVIPYILIATVVIFQPEIRRVLSRLRRSQYVTTKDQNYLDEEIILEMDRAIQYLARERVGALITIERDVNLDEYIDTGKRLDAIISEILLVTIFSTNTKLHDSAVIISNGRIAVGNAYLPLSDNKSIPEQFGTRHRAAVGISEVSDAVTIVVSEETGDISIAVDSELFHTLAQEDFLRILRKELTPIAKNKFVKDYSCSVWNRMNTKQGSATTMYSSNATLDSQTMVNSF